MEAVESDSSLIKVPSSFLSCNVIAGQRAARGLLRLLVPVVVEAQPWRAQACLAGALTLPGCRLGARAQCPCA